jgi:FkbM family methyltransferase
MTTLLKRIASRAGLRVVSAGNAGVRYLDYPPRGPLDDALLRVFPSLSGLNFIQVGCNDGIRADPIRRYVQPCGWKGLMVEPVPGFFAELRRNYPGNTNLKFLNAAVAREAGTLPIYQIRPGLAGLPDWVQGLASLDRGRVLKAAAELGLPPDAVVAETVRTVAWADVLALFGDRPCDVLVIDVEGHDLEILRLADLGRLRPQVIQFEHACNERAAVIAFYSELIALGYEIATSGQDTVCHLPQRGA